MGQRRDSDRCLSAVATIRPIASSSPGTLARATPNPCWRYLEQWPKADEEQAVPARRGGDHMLAGRQPRITALSHASLACLVSN